MNGDEANNRAKFSFALLVVASQTFSKEQKEQVLRKVKSSLCQIEDSVLLVNLAEELDYVIRANACEPHNFDEEYRVVLKSANFCFELLINSTLSSFKRAIRTFLQSECLIKNFICTGIDNHTSNNLAFQDALFSFEEFFTLLNEKEPIQTLNTQNPILNFNFNSKTISDLWKTSEKISSNKNQIKLNEGSLSNEAIDANKSYDNFISFLSTCFNERPITELMEETKITGALNVERPSLYIFPAREGDCSFFTFNGYSMLINGGYERMKPCFWQFASMLKQIDSIMLTHMDADALGGLSSFFAKKLSEPNVKPNVLSILGNLVGTVKPLQDKEHLHLQATDADTILDAIEKLKLKHIQLVKNEVLPVKPNHQPERINLYYKLGYGSLDMFVLSPFSTAKEYKDFLSHTSAKVNSNVHKSQLNVNNTFKDIPITHICSAVVLLTWTPSKPNENILRMLFTGNAPQHVIANALEKCKEFDILKSASCKVKCEKEVGAVKKPVAIKSSEQQKSATTKVINGIDKATILPVKPIVQSTSLTSNKTSMVGTSKHLITSTANPDNAIAKKAEKPVEKKEIPAKQPLAKEERVKKEETDNQSKKSVTIERKSIAPKKDEVKPKAEVAVKSVAAVTKSEPSLKPVVASASPKVKPIVASLKSASNSNQKQEMDKKEPLVPLAPNKKLANKVVNKTDGPPKQQGMKTVIKQQVAKSGKKQADVIQAHPSHDNLMATRLVAEVGDTTSSLISTVATENHTLSTNGIDIEVKQQASVSERESAFSVDKIKSYPVEENAKVIVSESVDSKDDVVDDQAASVDVDDVFDSKDWEVKDEHLDSANLIEESSRCDMIVPVSDLEDQAVESCMEETDGSKIVGSNEEAINQRSLCSDEASNTADDDSSEQIIEYDVQQAQNDMESDAPTDGIEKLDDEAEPNDVVIHVLTDNPNGHHYVTDGIEKATDGSYDERDVIDPTEVNTPPNVSPVKRSPSKDSIENANSADEDDELELCSERDDLKAELANAMCIVADEKDFISTPPPHSGSHTSISSNQDVMTKSFMDDGVGHNPFQTNEQTSDAPRSVSEETKDTCFDSIINGLKALDIKNNGITNGHDELSHVNGNTNGQYIKEGLVLDEFITEPSENNQKENVFKHLTPVNTDDPTQWNLLNLPQPIDPATDVDPMGNSNGANNLDNNKKATTKKPVPQSAAKQTSADVTQKPSNKSSALNTSLSIKPTATSHKSNSKPIHPYYFDVSYIPAHGNPYYADSEFFKRVRARYYVLSTIEPTLAILNGLIEGKQAWEDKELQVSLIPTYESDILRQWFTTNADELAKLNIDVLPSANYNTLTIDGNPDIAYQVYKLEF